MHTPIAVALTLMCTSAYAGQYDTFECTKPDGSTYFSAAKCAKGEKQKREANDVPPGESVKYIAPPVASQSSTSETSPCRILDSNASAAEHYGNSAACASFARLLLSREKARKSQASY